MNQQRYNIYPSLLDKYQFLLDCEQELESSFNETEEGYKESFEEIQARAEQELLDAINRVDQGPIEAADKGTCFNEIVDCLIHNRKTQRQDVIIRSIAPTANLSAHIEASMHGFFFRFDTDFCKEAAEYFKGCVSQVRVEAILPTKYGDVLLYGYIDELGGDKVYDIKTTKSYDGDKFINSWQKKAYPYCLTASGDAEVSEFEYTCYQLKGGGPRSPIITGDRYCEIYPYDHEQATADLQQVCEGLIEFLEEHRAQITDKKIFNYQN